MITTAGFVFIRFVIATRCLLIHHYFVGIIRVITPLPLGRLLDKTPGLIPELGKIVFILREERGFA